MFTLDSNANEEISVARSLVNAFNWFKPEKKKSNEIKKKSIKLKIMNRKISLCIRTIL